MFPHPRIINDITLIHMTESLIEVLKFCSHKRGLVPFLHALTKSMPGQY